MPVGGLHELRIDADDRGGCDVVDWHLDGERSDGPQVGSRYDGDVGVGFDFDDRVRIDIHDADQRNVGR